MSLPVEEATGPGAPAVRAPGGHGMAREVVVYAGAVAFARGISFLLTPLYARLLSRATFGAFETLNVTRQMAMVLLGLGMRQAVLRFHARLGRGAERTLVGTAAVVPLAFGVLVVALAATGAPVLSTWIVGRSDMGLDVMLVLGAGLAESLFELILQVHRARRDAHRYAFLLGGATLLFGLGTVGVLATGGGVAGIFTVRLVVFAVAVVIVVPLTLRGLPGRPQWALLPRLLAFGAPLVPTALAWWVVQASDRYFLIHLVGAATVAEYSIAARASGLVGLAIVVPFQLAWAPQVFRLHADRPAAVPGASAAILSRLVAVLLLGLAAFVVVAPDVVWLLGGARYASATGIALWLVLVWPALAWYHWCSSLIQVEGRTLRVTALATVAGVLNLVLNALLIPHWGALGAAVATVVATAAGALVGVVIAARSGLAGFEPRRLAVVAVLGAGVAAFVVFGRGLGPLAHHLAGAGLVVALAALLSSPLFATADERAWLRRQLGRLRP